MLNVNVTIEVRSLVSEAAKHFKLTMASRRAAFSGNTSLIATLSSYLCNNTEILCMCPSVCQSVLSVNHYSERVAPQSYRPRAVPLVVNIVSHVAF